MRSIRSMRRPKGPSRHRVLAGLLVSLAAIGLLAAALGSPLDAPQGTAIDWPRLATYGFLLVLFILVVLLGLAAWWLMRWVFEKLEEPSAEAEFAVKASEEKPPPRTVVAGLLTLLAGTVGLAVYLLARKRVQVELPPIGPGGGEPLPTALVPSDPIATVIVQVLNVAVVLLAVIGWVVAAGIAVTAIKRRPSWKGSYRSRTPEPASAGPASLPVADLEPLCLPLDGEPPTGLDPRTSVIWCYHAFLWAVARTGFGASLEPAKLTPREFRSRTIGAFPDLAGPVSDLTSVYERCRYGEHPMAAADAETARINLEQVRGCLAPLASAPEEEGRRLGR